MKYFSSILFLGFVFCLNSTALFAQNWGNGTKGQGEIVSKDLTLDDFTGVDLGISGDVILTQGPTQKVRVEGQKNIIDLLKTEVSKGIWKIGFTKNVNNHKNITIYITIPTLTKTGVSGSGSLKSTNSFKNLNKLSVFLSGSGSIKIDALAQSMKTRLSGSGRISLIGTSATLDIKISGSGNLNAYDLSIDEASVNISGSGKCELNVSKTLSVRISGSGNVDYKGNANVKAKITGSGDVRQKS